MSGARLGRATAAVLTAALVAGALLTAPVAAESAHTAAGVISPGLITDLTRGPAPAILSWDRQSATHAQVATYLRNAGVDAHIFEGLPAAVSCAASPSDVQAMARAPGALSVWGEESLTPTIDESRTTAFNGEENEQQIYEEWGLSGQGVTVGVVDTGLDGTHPDISGKVHSNVRVLISHREYMGNQDPPPCQDVYSPQLVDSELTSGHGTHMASIAAGSGDASDGRLHGIAPGAGLVAAAVGDSVSPRVTDPTGDVTLSLLGAIAGFNHILLFGLEAPALTKAVIAGWSGEGLFDPFHPVYLAARDLWHFDIVVVFPAGNDGPDDSDCGQAESCHYNPFAVGPYVMGVGATPKTSRTELSAFSSRGDPRQWTARGVSFRYEPALVAPGEHVVAARRVGTASVGTVPGSRVGAGGSPLYDQTDPRYVALTGTSVAAAHVAGAVALIQEDALARTGCFLAAWQVQQLLAETTTEMPGYDRWEVGAGALDIHAALTRARDPDNQFINFSPDPWVCPPS